MKKSLSSVIITFLAFFIPSFVNASSTCSYSEQVELNDLAANVKASYEYGEKVIEGGGMYPDTMEPMDIYLDYYKIRIVNITDKIYITVKNSKTGFNKTYYYMDTKDGVVEFDQDDVSFYSEYDIKVYSNNSNCAGEAYRTFTLKAPLLNSFSYMAVCNSYPNYRYCQKFIDADINLDYTLFYEGLNSYKKVNEKQEEQKKENKFLKFYKDHALVINITGGMIVALGVATTVILVKRKRSRVL